MRQMLELTRLTSVLHLSLVEDIIQIFCRSRRDRLQAAVSQNQTALELFRELYTSGLGDFLAVLDAQRQLYGNEDLLAQTQTAVTTNLIALYKALGGGWESFPQR
jgi:outer membrane protein TolC